jgi:hypothetical protein
MQDLTRLVVHDPGLILQFPSADTAPSAGSELEEDEEDDFEEEQEEDFEEDEAEVFEELATGVADEPFPLVLSLKLARGIQPPSFP